MNELIRITSPRQFQPRQLTVVSGKGGTGKTSLVASFAVLAGDCVVADCDVDAADLHLVLEPRILRRGDFTGGRRARIKAGHCTACGKCEELCRFDAIFFDGPGNDLAPKTFRVDLLACEGCGVCAWFCSEGAIEFSPVVNGEWCISETRCGPMVHARLGVAEENPGKLVSLVRNYAREIAQQRNLDLVLIDGSPGIGCPVIASLTGVTLALIVTEPTVSGLHDLERIAGLTRHFGIPASVCVNKWDLNPQMCEQIEAQARRLGLEIVGRVRYDPAFTEAQVCGKSVVEYTGGGSAEDVRRIWAEVESRLKAAAAAT